MQLMRLAIRLDGNLEALQVVLHVDGAVEDAAHGGCETRVDLLHKGVEGGRGLATVVESADVAGAHGRCAKCAGPDVD